MNLDTILRPDLLGFSGYQSAGRVDERPAIRLDANESPWAARLDPPSESNLNRYPEPRPVALSRRMASYYGVALEQVLITPGSDAAIDLLVRATCRAGRDQVIIQPPTFGMYAVCARLQGAPVIEVPLNGEADFATDREALWASLESPDLRLVFFCSPNNPTGGESPRALIESVCEATADRALVVVDEAYQEFSDEPGVTSQLERHANLVVLRTLSKAHALAAIRCGVLLGGVDLVKALSGLLAPYPLPTPTIHAAMGAFTDSALAATRTRVSRLRDLRDALRQRLEALSVVVRVLPSAANFLLFQVLEAADVAVKLARAGVQVRAFGGELGRQGWLRATVGSESENTALIEALERLS